MKAKTIALAIVLIAAAAVALYAAHSALAAPTVKSGDSVSVYFTGAYTNGTVFDSNIGGPLFNFTVGASQVIPGFDQAVMGMKLNQTKTVKITPSEGYGSVNPTLIVSLPIKEFGNQTIKSGEVFTQTAANGQQLSGRVVAFNSTNVTLDFNPLLAGQTLMFTIRVVRISG